MSPRVIRGLVLRYVFLYTRSAVRVLELFFWPMMDLLVWGFLAMHLLDQNSRQVHGIAIALIGATILWDVLFRSQQAVAISFLEDVWTRNLLNVFAAPVRIREYVAATFAVGTLRICVTVGVLTLIAWVFYGFRITDLGPALMPFFANLLIFGWSLGMISTALIMRWGQAAEALAWAVPFFVQPLCAVFYPVDALPTWLQPISRCIPCTHVFEGMREALASGSVDSAHLLRAILLNLLFACAAGAFFAWILRLARRRGLLTKIAVH